jgi:hypothetical protein
MVQHALVDFAQDVVRHGLVHALDLLHLVVLAELLAEAQAVGELLHDHVVAAAFPQRLDHLLAPLERAVRRGDGTAGFELRARGQQVDGAVLVEVVRVAGHGRHGRRGRRVRVDHHEQVELVHGPLHLEAACLRVGRMAPIEHAAQVRVLVDQLVLLEHAVDPARHGDAGLGHHRGRCEAALDPFVVDTPGGGEVLPRPFDDAVVAGQRIGVRAHVGGALHVVVAAEDVGAAARLAHVAERKLQDARGAHDRIADGVLRLAHAPHDGARAVLVEPGGHLEHLRLFHAAGLLDLVGRPLGQDLFAHLLHAEDAVVDVLLVFPAILEDVVQDAEQEGDVRARADPHVFVGLGRGAGEARIDHDHLAPVLLGMEHVQHADRMRLGGVGADVHRHLGAAHVVVRIGHGAVAPCVRHARDGRRMADARLVVAVVAAPEAHELAHQVRLLVAVLGGADPVDRIGSAGLAQVLQLGGDLVERRVPADALVLAVDQLHRIAQPVLAVAVLAQRGALGAMRTEVDGRIEHRLLAHPHAVLDHRIGGAADRAVGAHGALDFDLAGTDGGGPSVAGRLGLAHQRELARGQSHAHAEPGAPKEGAPVHGGQRAGKAAPQAVNERRRRLAFRLAAKHGSRGSFSWSATSWASASGRRGLVVALDVFAQRIAAAFFRRGLQRGSGSQGGCGGFGDLGEHRNRGDRGTCRGGPEKETSARGRLDAGCLAVLHVISRSGWGQIGCELIFVHLDTSLDP